jgi:hypothetical protein
MLMHLKRKNKTKKLEDINKSQHSYYYYYYFKLQRVDVPSWIHINISLFQISQIQLSSRCLSSKRLGSRDLFPLWSQVQAL